MPWAGTCSALSWNCYGTFVLKASIPPQRPQPCSWSFRFLTSKLNDRIRIISFPHALVCCSILFQYEIICLIYQNEISQIKVCSFKKHKTGNWFSFLWCTFVVIGNELHCCREPLMYLLFKAHYFTFLWDVHKKKTLKAGNKLYKRNFNNRLRLIDEKKKLWVVKLV